MNIYAKPGDKVVFLDENGHDWQREEARKLMKKYRVYTVDHTDVGGFHTDVYLKEFPDEFFNAVMFDDYDEVEKNEATPKRDSKSDFVLIDEAQEQLQEYLRARVAIRKLIGGTGSDDTCLENLIEDLREQC